MNSAGSERSLVADMDHNKRKRSEGNERSEEDELSIKRERSEDGGGVEEKVKGEEKAEHKPRINNKYHFKKKAKKVKKRRRRQGHRHRHRHRHNPLRGSAHENTSQRSSSATANRRHPNVSSIFRYCQLKTPPLSPPGLVNDWPRTPYPYLDMHTPPNCFPNFDFPPFNPIAFRNSRGKRVRLTLPATTSDRENEHKVPSDITSDQENQHKVPSEITWDRENEHKVPFETKNEIQEKSL